jgi:3-oxoadipate enol-lactonase
MEGMIVPMIRVRDINLYYEATGQGSPLLFIHGLGMSTRDWEKQAVFFSKDYRVITFDVRGHGRSDKPSGPYSISMFAADTAGLIEALGLAPVHIVGISLGGMIAFQLAVSSPELVKTMVIVNSGPEFIIRTARQRFEMLRRQFLIRVMGMRKMAEFLVKRLFPKEDQRELRGLVAERWAQNNRKAYLDSFQALEGWSVSRHLGDIRCPALVISADQDYTPVSYKSLYVSKMVDAKLVVVADSRHATPLDQPDCFNRILADFLSKHS